MADVIANGIFNVFLFVVTESSNSKLNALDELIGWGKQQRFNELLLRFVVNYVDSESEMKKSPIWSHAHPSQKYHSSHISGHRKCSNFKEFPVTQIPVSVPPLLCH